MRYEVTVCDESGCETVKRTNSLDLAKRRASSEVKRRGKKVRQEKSGSVRATVREVSRADPEGRSVFEAEERYGEPGRRRRPPRRSRPAPARPVFPELEE